MLYLVYQNYHVENRMKTEKFFLVCACFFIFSCSSGSLWDRLNSPDYQYLEVLQTVPADNETNVSVNTMVTLVFSDNIDVSTMTAENITINDGTVPFSFQYDEQNKAVTLVPAAGLSLSTTYRVLVNTRVLSPAGEPLEDPCYFSFSTVTGDQPEIDVKVDSLIGSFILQAGDEYYFGLEQTGSSRSATVITGNSGTADLTIGTISIGGPDAGMFSIDTSSLYSPVVPGGDTSFSIIYTPSAEGTHTGSLSIVNNDATENPFVLDLRGSALAAPAAEITVLQGENIIPSVDGFYDFGTVPRGSTTDAVFFTIQNTGVMDLVISSIILGDKNASEFILSTAGMDTTIVPGGATVFSVRFSPDTLGTKKGSITISSNDPVNPSFAFRVKGRGY